MGEWALFLLLSQVVFWSSIKYLVGVGLALLYLPVFQGWLYSTLGGFLGILMFVFVGDRIQNFLISRWPRLFSNSRFNKKNRFLVKIRQKGGLLVVSLLTPLILSIPLGCLFSVTFVQNRWKVIAYQSISLLFWSAFIFAGRYYLTKVFPI
jgi:hypothetical protein